jgi:hypothetical protein
MKSKKCPHRAGEGKTTIGRDRLSPAPSPVKSSLVLHFLQQTNFTRFRAAFPHLFRRGKTFMNEKQRQPETAVAARNGDKEGGEEK